LIPDDTAYIANLVAEVPKDRIVREIAGVWDRIVLDRFRMSASEVEAAARHGLTIGVDLGGEGREYCEYLVDILPRLDRSAPNLSEPGFLALPAPRAEEPSDEVGRILVTFGGEDPARLSESTARHLAGMGLARRVTVVAPSMRPLGTMPEGVDVLDPVPSLEHLLREAAVVVTSFGMTAYEASAIGVPTITIAPTPYHDRLARRAGFVRAGVRRASRRALVRLFRTGGLPGRGSGLPTQRRSLSEWIDALPAPEHRGCPAHPSRHGPAVWRSGEKSYFRCPVCGIRYLERFASDTEAYEASYFMEEYRAQYGRTYLEDFDFIYSMGKRRIATAASLLRSKGERPRVLDIGCAYGPFLAAARDAGYDPYGIDIACEAVGYVQNTLGITAVCGDIAQTDIRDALGTSRFHIVTLWYVIEHVTELDRLLVELARLVPPGGVLAFSTPHGAGVSARRSTDAFYAASPRDHHTIWDRPSARRVLREYGFRVKRFVVTGHHPERYPRVRTGGMPHSLARVHSRIFGWGDTFEVYAVREER
ncbi:MAG: methyltransferase domain-containing protein, partial [Spirochaetota bacterium]